MCWCVCVWLSESYGASDLLCPNELIDLHVGFVNDNAGRRRRWTHRNESEIILIYAIHIGNHHRMATIPFLSAAMDVNVASWFFFVNSSRGWQGRKFLMNVYWVFARAHFLKIMHWLLRNFNEFESLSYNCFYNWYAVTALKKKKRKIKNHKFSWNHQNSYSIEKKKKRKKWIIFREIIKIDRFACFAQII